VGTRYTLNFQAFEGTSGFAILMRQSLVSAGGQDSRSREKIAVHSTIKLLLAMSTRKVAPVIARSISSVRFLKSEPGFRHLAKPVDEGRFFPVFFERVKCYGADDASLATVSHK
jgi:hypothetical protein